MPQKKKPARQGQISDELVDAIVESAVSKVRGAPAVRTKAAEATAQDLPRVMADQGIDSSAIESTRESRELARAAGVDLTDGAAMLAYALRNGRNADGTIALGAARSGAIAASFIGHVVRARGNYNLAYRDAKAQRANPVVIRALGESTVAGGGALVPVEVSSDFMELLRETTAYLLGGPNRMQLATGTASIPGLSAGASGTWIGEDTNITKSEQTFRTRQISLRKLAVLTPVSNDLIYHSMPTVQELVRQDLVDSAGVSIDSACLRGLGTAFEPLGVENEAHADTTFSANATVNAANITADAGKMMRLQHDKKVKMLRASFIMSGRSYYHLMTLRDGNNNLIFAPDLARGLFMGKPVYVTHNIPDNLGGSSDESKVFLISYEHEIFADGIGPEAMRVEFFENATYHNGSSVISGISQDQSVVRLIAKADRVSRQLGKNITKLNAVKWGA